MSRLFQWLLATLLLWHLGSASEEEDLADAEEELQELDLNKDGKVTLAEFLAALEHRRHRADHEEEEQEAHAEQTEAEKAEWKAMFEARLKRSFVLADADGDG